MRWKGQWVNKFKEYQNIELTMFWALFLLRGLRVNAKLNAIYQKLTYFANRSPVSLTFSGVT